MHFHPVNYRALSSGFEEVFLYQNFARHQGLHIRDPMLVSTLVKAQGARKDWPKLNHLDIPTQFLGKCWATKQTAVCLLKVTVCSSINLFLVYAKSQIMALSSKTLSKTFSVVLPMMSLLRTW